MPASIELLCSCRRTSVLPVLYPDQKQRTALGWQIRWVAGLFCLLMVAPGAIPAYATEIDRELDSRSSVLVEASQGERVKLPDDGLSSGECLDSSSTWEPEVETEETDASPSLRTFELSCSRAVHRAARRGDRLLPSTHATGRRFARAPPLA